MDRNAAYGSNDTFYGETDREAENQIQIHVAEPVKRRYLYAALKRGFDVVLSAAALILLFPLFLVTAIAIRLEDGGPAIYAQPRAGKNGKRFRMYKFRSMCMDADEKLRGLQNLNEMDGPVFKITNDPRVTKVGKIIRKKSIDELPQLINIIKGDMSIVGPRPPLLNEVMQYTPEQMHRLDVTPGLTCYWQCSGRNNVGFEHWVYLDLKYIRERGIWTDIKVILRTVPVVLFGWGAY